MSDPRLEHIPGRIDRDPVLVHRGRYVTLTFLLGIGDEEYLVDVREGRVAGIEPRRLATRTGRFSIRAARRVWDEFWRPVPSRGHHDLFSMLAAGNATIDGDLVPLMQNLQYFKDLLAAGRAEPGEGGAADA